MKISVIVCCFNRSRMLCDLIPSLQNQVIGVPHEIIIVDNNSTDDTKEVAFSFIETSVVPIRYVFEEKQGLSNARNRGINEAKGEIVAFIDDDAVAEKDWLANLVAAFSDPKVGCSGGQIKLLWLAPRPDWLPAEMEGPLGRLDYGDEIIELEFPRAPFGGNISFRKSVLRQAGFFSTNLGRDGKTLLSNEELDMCSRVNKYGWKILYVPEAVIHHKVPEERLKKQWFYHRMYWQGRSDAVLDGMKGSYRYKKIRDPAAGMAMRLMNKDENFEGSANYRYAIGYLYQLLQPENAKGGDFRSLRAFKTYTEELIKKDGQQIETFLNSWSWKVTAPLRNMMKLFKKIR